MEPSTDSILVEVKFAMARCSLSRLLQKLELEPRRRRYPYGPDPGLRRRHLRILFGGRSRFAPPVDPANVTLQHGYSRHLGTGRSHYRKKRASLWFDG